MSVVKLRVGDVQAGGVQIYIDDPAHDADRQPWWPRLEGAYFVYNAERAWDVHRLLTDAANSCDDSGDREMRDSLAALATRVGRSAP